MKYLLNARENHTKKKTKQQGRGTRQRGSVTHLPPHKVTNKKRRDRLPSNCPLTGPWVREQTREEKVCTKPCETSINTAPKSTRLVVHTEKKTRKREKLARKLCVHRQTAEKPAKEQDHHWTKTA